MVYGASDHEWGEAALRHAYGSGLARRPFGLQSSCPVMSLAEAQPLLACSRDDRDEEHEKEWQQPSRQ